MKWVRGKPSIPGGEVYYMQAVHNDITYTISKVRLCGVFLYSLWRGAKEHIEYFKTSEEAKARAGKLGEEKHG